MFLLSMIFTVVRLPKRRKIFVEMVFNIISGLSCLGDSRVKPLNVKHDIHCGSSPNNFTFTFLCENYVTTIQVGP